MKFSLTLNKSARLWLSGFLLAVGLPFSTFAVTAQELDYSEFAQIPILHEGRIKPLGSFARVMLKQMSGQKSFEGLSAQAWLAQILFTPLEAMQQKLFTITSIDAALLALPETGDQKYNFLQLSAAFSDHPETVKAILAKAPKLYTQEEKNIAELYTATRNFAELAGAFSLLLPLQGIDEKIRINLNMKASGDADYLDMLKVKEKLMASLAQTVRLKGYHIENYSPEEARFAQLAFTLHVLENADLENNALLRVIPPLWDGNTEWLSAWAVIRNGAGSPQSARLFVHWQTLARAYRTKDVPLWNITAHALLHESEADPTVRPWAMKLETEYNAWEPLHVVLLGYGLVIGIVILAAILSPRVRSDMYVRMLLNIAYYLLLISVIIHLSAIAARMALLWRPPVSTLYESMIFVSAVAAGLGVWTERKNKQAGGLAISAIIGAFLLMAAAMFAGSSDTLEVLVAVLNTNFWLATHVVCITTGYSTSLLTGALAHLYLFKRINPRTDANELAVAGKRIYHAALVALLFTSVGTMLGGIWADQSWGRFWGWDPKENGALWIVLWLIWMLHGRIAGQLSGLAFAITGALITIVVALAWVGVNLLGVGLHSYGFTNAAATGLIIFCMSELLLIAMLTAVILWRQKPSLPL